MKNERKILYLSVVINYAIGIILGIILFFGQLRSGGDFPNDIYEYEKDVSVTDFIRMIWITMMWLFSVVAAYGILRIRLIHIVIILRGCISSFSALYVLHFWGIKEAVASILPQCVSVLPLLMIFSAEIAFPKSEARGNGIALKKYEVIMMIVLSVVSAGAEVLFFKAFCSYLF